MQIFQPKFTMHEMRARALFVLFDLLRSRPLKFQLDPERLVKDSLQIAFKDVHSDGNLTVFSSLFSYLISYCLMG